MNRLFALACIVAAFTAPARAQEKPWIPWNMTITVKEGGHFDKWEKPLPCKNGQISTTLWVKNPRTKSPWTAGAEIIFRNDDHEQIRFGLSTRTLQTARLYPVASQYNRNKVVAGQLRSEAITGVRAVKMDVYWKDAHTVGATIDGKAMNEMTLKAPIRYVKLFAQGTTTTFDRSTLECGLTS